MDKLPLCTPDLSNKNLNALVALFPNSVTETIDENGKVERAIDADVLAQEINSHVVAGKEERYQFIWPDKRKSLLMANAPISSTLRPCREESLNFDNTENLFIEGDNLDVLKLLRETYLNKVKMIYIDPPYNTGNDFIYEDDFADDVKNFKDRDKQYDEYGNRMVQNLESNGRFHTDWLNMMYPRLKIARDLLTDDGVIFISIDDNEIIQLRKICDEIFGEVNFINQVIWKRNSGGKTVKKQLTVNVEHLLIYAKSPKYNFNAVYKPLSEATIKSYSKDDDDGRGKYCTVSLQKTASPGPETTYNYIDNDGKEWKCPDKGWRMVKEKVKQLENDGRLYFDGDTLREKCYWNERPSDGKLADTLWDDLPENSTATKEISILFKGKVLFSNPKPIEYLIRMMKMQCSYNENNIILDFFSGSSTTAHAVMQLNAEDNGKRKFVMVQLPEICAEESEVAKAGYKNICEIGKERIRRAGRKIIEKNPLYQENLDIGFRVLKLDISNMKDMYYTPQELITDSGSLQMDLDGFIDNIKPDRTAEDLLFQVMLNLGISLSSKIVTMEISGKIIFNVGDNYLLACFDSVTDEIVTEIAKNKPRYAVFRDNSFNNDATLVNFEQIFKTYSPTTERKVL